MALVDGPTREAVMVPSVVINLAVLLKPPVIEADLALAAAVAAADSVVAAVADDAAAVAEDAVVGVVVAAGEMPRLHVEWQKVMTQPYKPSAPAVDEIMSNPVRLHTAKLARLVFCLSLFLFIAWTKPIRGFADDPSTRVFPTPQAAVEALMAAAKAADPKTAIMPILGPDGDKILSSGDQVADENARKRFISKYDEMHRMAEYASRIGFRYSIGRCYERDEPFPYLPFVEIIESDLAQAASLDDYRRRMGDNAAELAQIVPSLRRIFPDISQPLELPPAQQRRYLLQSVSEALARAAQTRSSCTYLRTSIGQTNPRWRFWFISPTVSPNSQW
jgi:hypothetical protein